MSPMRPVVLGLFAISIAVSLASAQASARRPNIVVMVADDLGYGDVGYHNSRIRTPRIDALADRGIRLEQFYVQPVCSPTRAALMTGRYPMRFGMQVGVVRPWANYGLPTTEITLPRLLRKAGYYTAAVGKWHLGHARPEYHPNARGFDHHYGCYNGAIDYFEHTRDGGLDWHRNGVALLEEGYATDLIAQEACRIIKQHDTSDPLFLYVPFTAVHTPLQVPQDDLDAYSHFKFKNRQTFAAMTTRMDRGIGTILDQLEETFDLAETLIIFCSDNGGIRKLGSNGQLRDGKGSVYEGGTRVPAIVVWKGHLQAGAVVHSPIHIIDWFPTLLK
ncbi:MAG: arylsulfatase, partial [Planctomycetota bacterium]